MVKQTKANIAAILKEYRRNMGLSGKQVVSMLKEYEIDISEKTLLGYENGVGTPRVNTFLALCSIYKISDIMGEFGLSTSLKLATGSNEWGHDLYNDFFNATLLEKLFILLRNGVPSFAGYEDQLEKCLPLNADSVNFDRLYRLFISLDETSQWRALHIFEKFVRLAPDQQESLDRYVTNLPSAAEQESHPRRIVQAAARGQQPADGGVFEMEEVHLDEFPPDGPPIP